jgi:hypothetical protein
MDRGAATLTLNPFEEKGYAFNALIMNETKRRYRVVGHGTDGLNFISTLVEEGIENSTKESNSSHLRQEKVDGHMLSILCEDI